MQYGNGRRLTGSCFDSMLHRHPEFSIAQLDFENTFFRLFPLLSRVDLISCLHEGQLHMSSTVITGNGACFTSSAGIGGATSTCHGGPAF